MPNATGIHKTQRERSVSKAVLIPETQDNTVLKQAMTVLENQRGIFLDLKNEYQFTSTL